MPTYQITKFSGGLSDYDNRGISGSFKMGRNLDIRKEVDSLSCNQALFDLGDKITSASQSPSASLSPSASTSPSISRSLSPSASLSPSLGSASLSPSASLSRSPSSSKSPSSSLSPSSSKSPSSSASSSPSPSAGLTTVFSDLIRTWVKASDGFLYGFGNTGKIYRIDTELNVSQVYDAGQAITGAEEKPSSSGKTYLVFATRTNLHIKEITNGTGWNDVNHLDGWPKTNLNSVDWHTMRQVGGDVFIANGSLIAMAAYDDSYTTEALQLVPGNIAKTIVERNGRSIIGTYRASDPDKGINAAIDSEVPLAQVGDDGDIYFANMVDSIPVKRFPGGGKVNPGGVCNEVSEVNFFEWEVTALSYIDKQTVGNMALFGVYGATEGYGGIYSLGRKNKNKPFVMNLEYNLDADEIGAIVNFNGIIFASYRDGTNFGVKATDLQNKATAEYEGLDFKAPAKAILATTPWNTEEIYMKPLPAGCAVEFLYKLDKDGEFIQAKLADGEATQYTTTNGKKAVFRIGAEAQIFEPKIKLIPNGNETPEIYRSITNFS